MRSRDSHVPSQSHVDPHTCDLQDLWHIPSISGVQAQAEAEKKQHKAKGNEYRNAKRQPPPPPPQGQPPPSQGQRPPLPPQPPRRPLTVQKTALIAALLYEWLVIESVIVSRNKNVQVILGGDFTKLGLTPDMLFNQEINQGLGLFEALEDTELAPDIVAAEETAAVIEAQRKRKLQSRNQDQDSKRTKRVKKYRKYPKA
ncbi:hypothetical protein [Paenibacillus aquistagni]|uniref:Uncharacterized protein n=1 Tax=Paenibacillus aquistagni TaxID=1852522 RepID=A0A1X7JKG4_9BACL|nr:hypothetical protein [Paenibacillus aquistagni]SMG27824.1 hypothetical protein SAMN06295960_1634 [Paenibacillus aquistagni]